MILIVSSTKALQGKNLVKNKQLYLTSGEVEKFFDRVHLVSITKF